jgi:SAM-dependent methyltransferase
MDEAFARGYRRLQLSHWWFRGRSRVLSRLLSSLPWPRGAEVLEIGVGPGHDLGAIYPPDAVLVGLEADPALAAAAREEGQVPVWTGSLAALPAELVGRRFDAVAMFDVLEHIDDEDDATRRAAELLRPGGLLLLSVPAYTWMWGRQDEVNRHFRRYSWRTLARLLRRQGFLPVRRTYFNTVLFPPIAALRLARRAVHGGAAARADARPGRSDFDVTLGPLDALLGAAFTLEAPLLRWVNLPFGVSLFAAARLGNGEG